MCGIFGLIGNEPVAARLMAGAGRLQNRGHRSTKIYTVDGKYFYNHGDTRPATIAFAEYDPRRLRGNSGIVHTRYVTSGKTSHDFLMRNIQPVFTDRPGMATCNNGDLINMYSQTQKLKEMGFSFQTEVDAKVIQATLISSLIQNKAYVYAHQKPNKWLQHLWQAVEHVQKELVGAYSVLCLMENGLLAFRGPHGIRPLSMAHRLDAEGNTIEVGFASESSVFNYFGDYHDVRDVEPGEAVWIDRQWLNPVSRVISQRREAFCFFEFVYFARPDTIMRGKRVEVIRAELGAVLAQECEDLVDDIDVVCGLPGTSVSAGQTFAHLLNKQYRNAIIKVDNRRSFQEANDSLRKKVIDEKFIFIRDFIEGQRIAIIDDSNVRGNTAKKIVARLWELGAKSVHMLYYTPPIIGPCFYGIDTPDETKLIAWNRSLEEIRELLNCTTVRYITHEGLYRGIGIDEDRLCTACITRKYPTDTAEVANRAQGRQQERDDSQEQG
ncbi:MAG: amidophosphoribosyltransferase [Candidatus Lernaella stagnicola]|nr:amidophosphoribosyltransferase [Candidatus Lernaella stagnicola]